MDDNTIHRKINNHFSRKPYPHVLGLLNLLLILSDKETAPTVFKLYKERIYTEAVLHLMDNPRITFDDKSLWLDSIVKELVVDGHIEDTVAENFFRLRAVCIGQHISIMANIPLKDRETFFKIKEQYNLDEYYNSDRAFENMSPYRVRHSRNIANAGNVPTLHDKAS